MVSPLTPLPYLALLFAAACSLGGPAAPGQVRPARVAALPHPADEGRVLGYNRVLVTSAVDGRTVTGARCTLTAPNISLSFQTPAEVGIPIMRRPLAPAQMYCALGDASGTRILHASRKLNPRDDDPDIPFGFVLGKAATLLSAAADTWTYVRNGDQMTVDMTSQRSGGIE